MKLTKTLLAAIVMLFAIAAEAGTAFFSYETNAGMNKICYYNYLGSTIAITISSTSLCPMTISP